MFLFCNLYIKGKNKHRPVWLWEYQGEPWLSIEYLSGILRLSDMVYHYTITFLFCRHTNTGDSFRKVFE